MLASRKARNDPPFRSIQAPDRSPPSDHRLRTPRFSADIAVRVPVGNLRRPDVTVFCQPYDFDAMVSDQPRLVLEVLSDSTRGTDQHQKLDEYKGLVSLEYIILIAPHGVDALVWSRQTDRSWVSRRYESLKDRIPLPALSCELAMADLYAGAELRTAGPRLVSG